jgi:hypothetical protein
VPEVNEAMVATYLASGNTSRSRGALPPLLKAAPLSKSAVTRVVATLLRPARTAYTAFERTWAKRCPGVVTSL